MSNFGLVVRVRPPEAMSQGYTEKNMRYLLPVAAAALLFLGGCTNAQSLDGDWVGEGLGQKTKLTFDKGNMTYVAEFNMNGMPSIPALGMTEASLSFTATYTFNNDRLVVKDTKLQMNGMDVPMTDDMKERMPDRAEINISWKNDHTILLSTPHAGRFLPNGVFERSK